MRNLKEYFGFSSQLNIEIISCITKGRDILGTDSFENKLNLFIADDINIYSYSCFSDILSCLCCVPESIGCDPNNVSINSIIYDDITDSIVVCLKNGDIISVQLDGEYVMDSKVLSSIPSGIDCAEWSPDREIVVIANSQSIFLFSATYYDVIIEIDLSTVDKRQDNLVAVGWGKKETQFHGSEGKAAAKKNKVVIDSNLINDDHKCHISWRGDSQIFSVSFWDQSLQQRFIVMIDKTGSILAFNEELSGLYLLRLSIVDIFSV